MSNLAAVLKTEVSRLARKQLRADTEGMKKTVAHCRSETLTLKKRVLELERLVSRLSKTATSRSQSTALSQPPPADGDASGIRFNAKGMAANRKRLGLSAADFGLLVGATGQSVYSWEAGKSKPRARSLAAIAALRGLGKKEVAARLAVLKGNE